MEKRELICPNCKEKILKLYGVNIVKDSQFYCNHCGTQIKVKSGYCIYQKRFFDDKSFHNACNVDDYLLIVEEGKNSGD